MSRLLRSFFPGGIYDLIAKESSGKVEYAAKVEVRGALAF